MVDAAELLKEQQYFDEAARWREAMRHGLGKAPAAAASTGAAARVKQQADRYLEGLQGPDKAVAIGRVDTESGHTWYVGINGIHDDDENQLVINWRAPAARSYFEATVDNSMEVAVRRTYTCEENTILEWEDLVYRELAAQIAELEWPDAPITDTLLEELQRRRTGEMEQIVRTIQAAQFHIIQDELDQLLVVQGGPGTGKTIVALHRVSWLLYNRRDRLKPNDVLVIGPNRTFVRYIAKVLPDLGDRNVREVELAELGPSVRATADETAETTRIKGELRMTSLVERGLRDRIFLPEGELELTVRGTRVLFDRTEVQSQVDRLASGRYNAGRQRLREFLRDEAIRRVGDLPPNDQQLENLVDRIWPQLSPQAFLQELYGSEGRLLRAAGSDFSAEEVQLLYRRAAERLALQDWSAADVPVLDYVAFRISGPPEIKYEHIVVDEVQDLSPMELGMIARRSAEGSMTVLGDLAQSTGAWARDSWDEVIEHLQMEYPSRVLELEYGYRVPRQIFEYAAQLLPQIAPTVSPPKVVRDGPADPERIEAVDENVGDEVVAAAQRYLAQGRYVGVICPAVYQENVTDAFRRHDVDLADAHREGISAPVSLVAPLEAKGLEFDAVIVVEPVAIAGEVPRGERLLYVALTRSTRHLTVVHTGVELPMQIGDPTPAMPSLDPSATRAKTEPPTEPSIPEVRPARLMGAVASQLAGDLQATVHPDSWDEVLERVRQILRETPDADDA